MNGGRRAAAVGALLVIALLSASCADQPARTVTPAMQESMDTVAAASHQGGDVAGTPAIPRGVGDDASSVFVASAEIIGSP